MNESFLTTQWTQVLAARGNSTVAGEALKSLCGNCYAPVVAFLERSPHTAPEARDLAHGFFEWLLSRDPFAAVDPGRGRFRSYLLGALKHYLSREAQARHRLKRGGPLSPTNTTPDLPEPTDPALPPDREFDRQWALHLLRQAMDQLAAEALAAGKAAEWQTLHPYLTGETTHGSLALLAAAQGIPEATLRSQLHRLRQRFRHHIKAAITPTLTSPGEVPDEMADLLAALSY
jgi:DNA-directed RNA polymerase specialized sigma24 family protein